jgi:hypothetical protein
MTSFYLFCLCKNLSPNKSEVQRVRTSHNLFWRDHQSAYHSASEETKGLGYGEVLEREKQWTKDFVDCSYDKEVDAMNSGQI